MTSVLIKSAERYSLAERKIVAVLKRVLREEQIENAEVSVAFVSPSKIRKLNQKYRGLDQPTSVLSFFQGQETPEGELTLGDIVICPTVAKKRNLDILDLVVHGLHNLLSEISTSKNLRARFG